MEAIVYLNAAGFVLTVGDRSIHMPRQVPVYKLSDREDGGPLLAVLDKACEDLGVGPACVKRYSVVVPLACWPASMRMAERLRRLLRPDLRDRDPALLDADDPVRLVPSAVLALCAEPEVRQGRHLVVSMLDERTEVAVVRRSGDQMLVEDLVVVSIGSGTFSARFADAVSAKFGGGRHDRQLSEACDAVLERLAVDRNTSRAAREGEGPAVRSVHIDGREVALDSLNVKDIQRIMSAELTSIVLAALLLARTAGKPHSIVVQAGRPWGEALALQLSDAFPGSSSVRVAPAGDIYPPGWLRNGSQTQFVPTVMATVRARINMVESPIDVFAAGARYPAEATWAHRFKRPVVGSLTVFLSEESMRECPGDVMRFTVACPPQTVKLTLAIRLSPSSVYALAAATAHLADGREVHLDGNNITELFIAPELPSASAPASSSASASASSVSSAPSSSSAPASPAPWTSSAPSSSSSPAAPLSPSPPVPSGDYDLVREALSVDPSSLKREAVRPLLHRLKGAGELDHVPHRVGEMQEALLLWQRRKRGLAPPMPAELAAATTPQRTSSRLEASATPAAATPSKPEKHQLNSAKKGQMKKERTQLEHPRERQQQRASKEAPPKQAMSLSVESRPPTPEPTRPSRVPSAPWTRVFQDVDEGLVVTVDEGIVRLPSVPVLDEADIDPMWLSAQNVLQSGSFGKVFKIELLGQPLALKLVDCNAENLKSVRREIVMLAGLRTYQYILQLRAVVNIRRSGHLRIGLLTDILPEGDLSSFIAKNPVSASIFSLGGKSKRQLQDAERFLTLTEAVATLHFVRAIHRDLKPRNVLMAGSNLQLADFGCARLVGDEADDEASIIRDATSVGVGTATYMAPELLQGMPYGLPVDVWSLGVTGLELFARQIIFDKPLSAIAVFDKIVEDNFFEPFLKRAPKRLQGVLRSCLSVLPSGRPNAAQLAAAVRAYIQQKKH